METRYSFVRRLCAYILLVLGAIVFSLPFLWMVCTSVKVDRELFPEKLAEIFPGTPNAISVSPFVDTEYFRYAETELTRPHMDLFEDMIRQSGCPFPQDVNQEQLIQQVSRGFARRMERLLPVGIWQEGEQAIRDAAERWLTPEVVEELVRNVYRWFGLGKVQLTWYSNVIIEEPSAELPPERRYHNLTPDTLQLSPWVDRDTWCAFAHIDFTRGDRWVVEQTCDTQFDVSDLHRVQLAMHPDDNWNRLYCELEKEGRLYRSVRAVYPANFEWGTVTWQEPGPEDETNKIKYWTHLQQVDTGPQYESGPRRLKLRFTMLGSNQLQAWWGKISRNYVLTLMHIPVARYTMTSLYLVVLNVILSVFACSLVAYSVARMHWPGRNFCFLLMLATMMLPAQVTMIPGFLIWKHLGFYNTLVPLWLGAAFASPFAVFLLRQFLKGIPTALEDSARIDGCSPWQIYWHIMLPLVKPTLAVIAIGAFLGAWNNFMGPLIFIADQRLYPLAFGLYAFAVQVGNNPSLTMAGSFMMTVPIIVIFFFAQRYFIEGVTLTGIKG